jgi:hypothetical protein
MHVKTAIEAPVAGAVHVLLTEGLVIGQPVREVAVADIVVVVALETGTKTSATYLPLSHRLAEVEDVGQGYTVMDAEVVNVGGRTRNFVRFGELIVVASSLGPSSNGAGCLRDKGWERQRGGGGGSDERRRLTSRDSREG